MPETREWNPMINQMILGAETRDNGRERMRSQGRSTRHGVPGAENGNGSIGGSAGASSQTAFLPSPLDGADIPADRMGTTPLSPPPASGRERPEELHSSGLGLNAAHPEAGFVKGIRSARRSQWAVYLMMGALSTAATRESGAAGPTPGPDRFPPYDLNEVKSWTSVHVRVDVARVLHTVSETAYHGINFVALWNPTGASSGTVQAVSQMGMHLIRFPGGCPAHWYDWKDPLATGWTRITPQVAWGLAKAGGARMIFQTNTANDGTGTNKSTGQVYRFDSSGRHAADWVQYCQAEGIEVAFWEIGNEPEVDAPASVKAAHSQEAIYAWYNTKYREHVEAMRIADPKARFLGPASCNVWFWQAKGNLARFLKAHGNRTGSGLADAISVHWYPEGGSGPWEQRRGVAQDWASHMSFLRKTIAQHDTRALPVYVTEWNWGAGDKNDSGQWLANALGTADVIGMFLRTGVAGHAFFCLQKIRRNWGVLATRNDGRPENDAAPTYYALVLASRLGGEVIEVSNSADERHVLSAYATRRTKGPLAVMMINKGHRPLKVEVGMEGAHPAGTRARVYTLEGVTSGATRPQYDHGIDPPPIVGNPLDTDVVFNGVVRPNPSRNPLPGPRSMALGAQGPIVVPMPPYAITLVEMDVRDSSNRSRPSSRSQSP